MLPYKRADARAWARENLVGCSAVTIPSYSADLKNLNEKGIRHDVGLAKEFGFKHTLLCAEVAITPEENAMFTAWAADGTAKRAAADSAANKLIRMERLLWLLAKATRATMPRVADESIR